LGVNLENTTSQDFRITATARYLAFDLGGSGSELRIDGTLGIQNRIEREKWIEQARILAAGGETEFSRRVDRGDV
ncbi:MAG: hypothetical protein AAFY53_11945, partial [Pseudomonadota bacterium]